MQFVVAALEEAQELRDGLGEGGVHKGTVRVADGGQELLLDLGVLFFRKRTKTETVSISSFYFYF